MEGNAWVPLMFGVWRLADKGSRKKLSGNLVHSCPLATNRAPLAGLGANGSRQVANVRNADSRTGMPAVGSASRAGTDSRL